MSDPLLESLVTRSQFISEFHKSNVIVNGSFLSGGVLGTSGYKHAANVLICAALAIDANVVIRNVPEISDTRILCEIIECLGGRYTLESGDLMLDCSAVQNHIIPVEMSMKSHACLYLLPVLLGKLGRIEIGQTGGCMIGDETPSGNRPVHHMLEVLRCFGADFQQTSSIIIGRSNTFQSCEIDIAEFSTRPDVVTGPLISGATKTAILAALFTQAGTTTIHNPYRKPDVTELLRFASENGFCVEDSEERIQITREQPPSIASAHDLVDDISTIMTYITTAIYNDISVTIQLRHPEGVVAGLKAELELFRQMGVKLEWNHDSLYIPDSQSLEAIDIEVTSRSIYSDHQPFFALLLTRAKSKSTIKEFVWKNRFSYVHELNKLSEGTPFVANGNQLTIYPSSLSKTNQVLQAKDLRSAAVLLIASTAIAGSTTIEGIDHLERGYENLVSDLKKLNATIEYTASDGI